jgi:hypothetical protein
MEINSDRISITNFSSLYLSETIKLDFVYSKHCRGFSFKTRIV